MADLTRIEKMKLEKYLDMAEGYVLDFSNNTFLDFVLKNTGMDIYEEKYFYRSGSKANRLRGFWEEEENYIVGKLLKDLIEYSETRKLVSWTQKEDENPLLKDECVKIASRLIDNSSVENIAVIKTNTDDKDFNFLANAIRESINKNQPETALDRLHTYTTKYIRNLCDRHKVSWNKNSPLHSIFGSYIKALKGKDAIHSEMTERILKSSISILDSFNNVRNEQSLAHDNPTLNYDESILIFNNVSSTIRFIESLEKTLQFDIDNKKIDTDWDNVTF